MGFKGFGLLLWQFEGFGGERSEGLRALGAELNEGFRRYCYCCLLFGV